MTTRLAPVNRHVFAFALIATICVLALSFGLVPSRAGATLTLDSRAYLDLARGAFQSVSAPFAWRIFPAAIPWLLGGSASWLVGINAGLLVATGLLLALIARSLRWTTVTSLSVIAVWALGQIRFAEMPWLTDPAGMFWAMFFVATAIALNRDRQHLQRAPLVWAAIWVAAFFAGATRELCALLPLCLVTVRPSLGAGGLILGVLGHVAARTFAIQHGSVWPDSLYLDVVRSSPPVLHPKEWALALVDSFGFIWVWVAVGFIGELNVSKPRLGRRITTLLLGLATLATFQASLGADTRRLMTMFCWPLAAILLASALDMLDERRRRQASAIVIGSAALLAIMSIASLRLNIGFVGIRLGLVFVSIAGVWKVGPRLRTGSLEVSSRSSSDSNF